MNNLDKQYIDLLCDILENGCVKSDRTGTGTISVFGRTIRHDMREGFPLITTKKMHYKGIVTELLWFLRGDTNIKYLLDYGCNIWVGDCYKNYLKLNGGETVLEKNEFIEKIRCDSNFGFVHGDLGSVYGRQWRDFGERLACDFEDYECGVDQIENLLNDLRTNPDSRRLIVSAWNPKEVDSAVLPPCHVMFQIYTERFSLEDSRKWVSKNSENDTSKVNLLTQEELELNFNCPKRYISLLWTQRSCDVPLGACYNIASYGTLLCILGKMVNMEPKNLIGNFGDSHIYLNQKDGILEQIKRDSFDLPSIHFSESINFNGGIGEFLNSCSPYDITVKKYKSHEAIKIPLSN